MSREAKEWAGVALFLLLIWLVWNKHETPYDAERRQEHYRSHN